MNPNKDKVKMKVDVGRGMGDIDKDIEFPENSNEKKRSKKDKEVNKVITGTVMTKKQSIGKKLSSNLLGDDSDSVSSYIVQDILIPSAKNTVFEMFSSLADMLRGSVELALFGRRTSNSRGGRGTPYVSYDKFHKQGFHNKYDDIPFKRELTPKARSTHNFNDIILTNRGDAEEVLTHLVDLTETYGMATVADLYELVGVTGEYTDNKYGWDSLGAASVTRVRGGYLVDLPRTRLLD